MSVKMEVKINDLKLLKLLSSQLIQPPKHTGHLAPSGISNSSWCLSETARGQLRKAQCLGDGEDRRCKSHSMECPADTH